MKTHHVQLDSMLWPALALAAAALLLAGCKAVSPKRPALPMPPMKARLAVTDKSLDAPFTNRTHWLIRWGDCEPQPEGVWYEVHERFTLSNKMTLQDPEWRLYARLTNTYSILIPLTNTMSFFLVSAVDINGRAWAVKDCVVVTHTGQ